MTDHENVIESFDIAHESHIKAIVGSEWYKAEHVSENNSIDIKKFINNEDYNIRKKSSIHETLV